jgi:hypothetical protein
VNELPHPAADRPAAETALRRAVQTPGTPRSELVAASERYLRAAFPGLCGLGQLWAHYHPEKGRTTDPLEHTLEVLAELDLDGLDARDQRALLWAAIFHDVGKVRDPYDRRHAQASVALAREPLAHLENDSALREDVLRLVATHDLLGHVLQGLLAPDDLLDLLDWDPRMLDLHLRLASADIRSIRGLRQIVPPSRLAAARALLERTLAHSRASGHREVGPGD